MRIPSLAEWAPSRCYLDLEAAAVQRGHGLADPGPKALGQSPGEYLGEVWARALFLVGAKKRCPKWGNYSGTWRYSGGSIWTPSPITRCFPGAF